MKPRKLITAFVIVFLAGAVVGGAVSVWMVTHRFFPPPSPPPAEEITRHVLADLRSQLDLDTDQVRRIEPIVATCAEQIGTLHRSTMAEFTRTMDESNARIAAELRPEQAKKFQEQEARRRSKMRDR